MQGTMSNNLCEALREMQIRGERQTPPRRSANLWSGMVNPRLCKDESVYETSPIATISKWRYGMRKTEGISETPFIWEKSERHGRKCLWLPGYKPSTSVEGVRNEKMGVQTHKDSHPELGCSGDLNPNRYSTPCERGNFMYRSYYMTELAAVDVIHEGRESRSSLRYGRHTTWRRTLASRMFQRK